MHEAERGDEGAAPILALRLLGAFQASVDGAPLPPLRTRKGAALLALLALREGGVERAWLAGALWPDSGPEQALYNLRQSLSDLRRALGAAATRLEVPTPRSLRLRRDGVALDTVRFDARVAEGAWQAAAELYEGPLLEGWYDEWVLPERQRREEAFRQAIGELASADPASAVAWWRRLVAVEPAGEGGWRSLMAALAAQGDFAGVRDAYERFHLYLHANFGAAPSTETAALHARLSRESEGGALEMPAGSGHLPVAAGPLIGRAAAVAAVVDRLRAERLVTLTGAGGIGKTRLALAAAHTLAVGGGRRVRWVDLAPLADGEAVDRAAAAAVGISEQAGEPLRATLLRGLQARETLLVLDNAEHLRATAAAFAAAVLEACPTVRLLVTSRQALGTPREAVVPVAPLPVPDLRRLPDAAGACRTTVGASAAVQLLVERAAAVERRFALTEANARAVARVCARLEGVPLAIELAAARLNVLAVEQIDAHLDHALPLLTRGGAAAPSRQQTLEALIDWSYRLLSEPERSLLRSLSVFRGGWDLAAAEAVAALGTDTLDLLAQLIECSLVVVEGSDEGTARYRMLETVRQFAASRREAADEGADLERHGGYYAQLVVEQSAHLAGPEETRALNRLEREGDNLRAALRYRLRGAGEPEAGLRLIVALRPVWSLRGPLREGLEWTQEGLEHPVARPPVALRAQLLAAAGQLALELGSYGPGGAYLEEALPLCRRVDDRRTLAAALGALSAVRGQQGDTAEQEQALEESLALLEAIGDPVGRALAYCNEGCLARKRGQFERAIDLQERSLALSEARGDTRGMAWSLNNLGAIALDQARYTEARAFFERSLALRRAIGDLSGTAETLNDLGCVLQERGDSRAALPFFEEGLALHTDRGNRDGAALALSNLGAACMVLGAFEQARDALHRSLALCRELANRRSVALTLHHLGDLATRESEHGLARRHYEECLSLFEALESDWGRAYALNSIAHALCAQGDFDGASVRLIAALRLCAATENLRCAEYALENGARLASLWGDPEASLRLAGCAASLRVRHDHPLSPAERSDRDELVEGARAALSPARSALAWEAGRAGTLADGVAELEALTDLRRGSVGVHCQP